MKLASLVDILEDQFGYPLPGPEAQMQMAPRPVDADRFQIIDRPNARQGGVLVLFYPDTSGAMLPLILRPEYDGTHSGQVSFPGGKQDEYDKDLISTALREAHEEIGIKHEEVRVLGKLSRLYIPPSNFSVEPVVAFTDKIPIFKPDAREVAKVLQIPFDAFLDEKNRREEVWKREGYAMIAPFFHIQDYVIWGATAMMISELIALVKRSGQ